MVFHELDGTDPHNLICHLHRHGVEYVLVGETAEIVHGAPFGYRDFDIAPNPDKANIARLKKALKLVSKDWERIDALGIQSITDLNTSHGKVSVILCAGNHGTPCYAQLLERSWQPPGFDDKVRVAALSDLIRTREILAGKHGRIPDLKPRRGDSWHWLHLKAIVQIMEEDGDVSPDYIVQYDPHLPELEDMRHPART